MVVSIVNICSMVCSAMISFGSLSLPEYPGTTESGYMNMIVNGEEAILFTGMLDRDTIKEVIEFYRDFLIRGGWKREEEFDRQAVELLIAQSMYDASTSGYDYYEDGFYYTFSKGNSLIRLWGFTDIEEKLTMYFICFAEQGKQSLERASVEELKMGMPSKDLPGDDPVDIPRYPGSIREGSLFMEDGVIQYFHYVTTAAPEKVYSFYEECMKKKGWQSSNLFSALLSNERGFFSIYFNELKTAYLYIDNSLKDGITSISIIVYCSETEDFSFF